MFLSVSVLCLLLSVAGTRGQDGTAYGRSFLVAFPPLRESTPVAAEPQCQIFINTYVTTTVNIQSKISGTTRTVNPGETYIYEDVNCESRVRTPTEIGNPPEDNKVFSVTSDEPISVMILSNDGTVTGFNNMDTTLMYPIDFGNSSTTEYFIYSYVNEALLPDGDGTLNACGNGTDTAHFHIVMALEDATTVTITNLDGSGGTGVLNSLQNYYFQNTVADIQSSRSNNFNGRYITSDKPIAVIAGTLCADVTGSSTDLEGVAFAAMPPVSAWSAGDYITYELYTLDNRPPAGQEQVDYYKVVVMASQDDTIVNVAGFNNTLGRGESLQYEVSDASEKVTCFDKCLVMQFAENLDESPDGGFVESNGICALTVQPTFAYGTYSVYTNYQVGFVTLYYVRIVSETDPDGAISIAGPTTVQDWEQFQFSNDRGSYWSYLGSIQDDEVQGIIESTNPNVTFSAVVYFSSVIEPGRGYCFNTGVTTPAS